MIGNKNTALIAWKKNNKILKQLLLDECEEASDGG